ncbi:MAG: hybrid sensor histidine kinase/response regulator [Candidatus Aminicenantes bacterium]
MSQNKHSVIIIDDEESMRDSCSMILKKDGFEIMTADNGEDGLQKIKDNHPDIALIDLKMPGLSGLGILDRLQEVDAPVLPIVITGYATVESAVEAMKKGAYDFLPKPFTPEELRIIIRRGLEKIKLAREAEDLRREKKLIEENFITMVSHQLRSPLVAIAQYFETILSGTVGEVSSQQGKMLRKAQERLEGLLNLINDWLDIARMNTGELVKKFKPVPLHELIKKQVEFLEPLAERSGVTLNLAPPEGNDRVMGDKETLEQIFSNLISNGIKYNREGGEVNISFREKENTVITDVSDTGIGIPQDKIPRLFEQFFQVNRTSKGKGSGLGLTIAQKIAEAHNGKIEVSSKTGKGSTFSVILPKAGTDS